MKEYGVFGGCLRSALPFPDLPPLADGEPDWVLDIVRAPPPDIVRGQRGAREIAPGWTLRLLDLDGGWRFTFGETGAYDLSADGREITWYPGPNEDSATVRSVVLGPVMALSLRNRGLLCLHGSAVATPGGVIGFLAPKHHGKSTLALLLMLEGARLVTDDLVAVRPGDPPMVRPGVHNIRLLPDAVERLAAALPCRIVEGAKPTVAHFPPERLQSDPARLAALYVLDPTLSDTSAEACERHRLRPTEAAAMIALHDKLPLPVNGPDFAAQSLRRAATLAACVPIYRLRTTARFERQHFAARQLLAWHSSRR